MRLALVAVAAFGAGLLTGLLVARSGPEGAAGRTREAVNAPRAGPARDRVREEAHSEARAPSPPAAREKGRLVDSPDEDQPLDPGGEPVVGSGEELVRWYRIHKTAWDLPDFDESRLKEHADLLLALDRIPRRDVLLRVLAALADWDASVARVPREADAWHAANPDATSIEGPGATAWRERTRDLSQRFLDRLHRDLSYSDYLLLFSAAELDGVEERPPPGAAIKGGDPYARPTARCDDFGRFLRWYHAYRRDLGFPDRDYDFLNSFHQHVVEPLGRFPEPALMRELQDAYLPVYPRLRDGTDWDASARELLERLRKVLTPLDFERVRNSKEWENTCRALGIPPATGR